MPKIHPTALVHPEAYIGNGTQIWAYCNILWDVQIGENCNICDRVFIENGVKIGNNVTIKVGIALYSGVTLANNVFVGPNVVFTNDIHPRSKQAFAIAETIIEEGVSLGASTTILGGITIGEYAMTGLGSVIIRDVPAYALMVGNPARRIAWIGEDGQRMQSIGPNLFQDSESHIFEEINHILVKK